jgi:NADH-quinone oxidoreductase subunit L
MNLPLWLLPALPLAGFLVLALGGGRLSRRAIAGVGAGAAALTAVVAMLVAASFLSRGAGVHAAAEVTPLWTWMRDGGLDVRVALRLDPLSLVMVLVVSCVGFLIHLYSVAYMRGDDGYARFFAYMNLFLGAMLILVLADGLVLLYLGWEGVGLCSYLLIGFWYTDPANGRAARKAFIVTRIGDVALAVGLFVIFTQLGTLRIAEVLTRAAATWPPGSGLAIAVALLLLGGAVGKSAQLPLQTWLPDAMAGPTPVSALIHAATMVTAGVYLVARTHTLFALAPPVMALMAIIGAATLLLAGFSALSQTDIKRVLAYSTISQLGYMFLALGVGAWTAAIFHLVTHAFFKALLFMSAGAVIVSLHHERDLRRMGGLRRELPTAYWTFLIGAAALAGVPLVTAGFFSKDLILHSAFVNARGGMLLWAAGLGGVVLTALYSFRAVFLAFHGERGEAECTPRTERTLLVPLWILAGLAICGGWIETPASLGGVHWLSHLLEPLWAGAGVPAATATTAGYVVDAAGQVHAGAAGGHGAVDVVQEIALQGIAAVAVLVGLLLARAWFLRGATRDALFPTATRVGRFWAEGWGFDALYHQLLVAPYRATCRTLRGDPLDAIFRGLAALVRGLHRAVAATQNGNLRWYVAGVAVGAVLGLGVVVLG